VQREEAMALELSCAAPAPDTPPPSSIDERIFTALRQTNRSLPVPQLLQQCRIRKATLYARLTTLVAADKLVRTPDGYRLTPIP